MPLPAGPRKSSTMSYGETAQRCLAKSAADVENDWALAEVGDWDGKMTAVWASWLKACGKAQTGSGRVSRARGGEQSKPPATHVLHHEPTETRLAGADEPGLRKLAVREEDVLKVELLDAALAEVLDGGEDRQAREAQGCKAV